MKRGFLVRKRSTKWFLKCFKLSSSFFVGQFQSGNLENANYPYLKIPTVQRITIVVIATEFDNIHVNTMLIIGTKIIV